MLEANRNEIHEVYTLCRILGQGYLAMGTADGEAGAWKDHSPSIMASIRMPTMISIR